MKYDELGNKIVATSDSDGFLVIDFSNLKGGWGNEEVTDMSQPGNETNDSGSPAKRIGHVPWADRVQALPEPDGTVGLKGEDLRFEKDVISTMRHFDVVDEAKQRRSDRDREPFVEPPVFRLPDLLARPQVAAQYTVTDLWPVGGNVLFAAPAKFGKSTVVMNLIRSLLDGTPFLGFFRTTELAAGESILLIDLEMSENRVTDELRVQDISNPTGLYVAPLRGDAKSFDVTNPEIRTYWIDFCLANNVKTLILDPLAPLLGHLAIDENDNSLVNRFFQQLDSFKKDAGIRDMMVVHHCGHSADWRPRGASRFNDWPDSLWLAKINGPVNDPASPREFFARGRDIWQSLSGEGTITPDVSNPKKLHFDTQSAATAATDNSIRGAINAQVYSSAWHKHFGNKHDEIVDAALKFLVVTDPDIKRNQVDETLERMRGEGVEIHGHKHLAPGDTGRPPWRYYPADTCQMADLH